jgi:choline dehydrogenase-like flavoprotein
MHGFYDNGTKQTLAGADTLGRLVGPELRAMLENGIDRLLNVLVITDDDVQPENRVTLSSELPPDNQGSIPRVALDGRARTARTNKNREFLAAKAVQLLRKAGAKKVHRWGQPPLILHVQSTMRMGNDPATTVLDTNCESRFVERLYVADNSALPNGLGGPNPTLTNQALSTRTAENIFVKYFGGHRWVRTESPLVSTHRKVTKAVIARGI